MNIREITDRMDWEAFQSSQKWMQFPQSWVWGEFQKSRGAIVQRFALTDEEGKWLVAAQGEFRKKKLGMGYWFVPRGPQFHTSVKIDEYRELLEEFIQQLYGKRRLPKALFWRMEPMIELESMQRRLPARMNRTKSLNPACTAIIDLTKSEQDLLASMHQKTRYNIKVADKHGVTTRITNHPKDVDQFINLMDETAARDGFVQHDSKYLAKTLFTLAATHMARLRVAELNGAILAANMEINYGNTVTYLYGASSSKVRQVMAPYALQWEAIKQAKAEGARFYDFWGCNPESKATPLYKKSWEGITRFKMGFGAERKCMIGTWDLPINLALYRLVFFRRLMKSV
ncbi:MAG: lipid II:glycine glycyltransferase FemX [Patescibacteria group bacterium]